MRITITAFTLLFMLQNASAIEILAETTNSENIRLNGKSYSHCVLYIEDGLTEFDKKETKFVKVGIGNLGEQLNRLTLFRIEENGDYIKRHYYPESDQIANRLSQKDLADGYTFESDMNGIKYSNGSSCMNRESFEIEFNNGNFRKTTSIQWREGMCDSARFFLALPSVIFGADRHGNNLKCVFTNH